MVSDQEFDSGCQLLNFIQIDWLPIRVHRERAETAYQQGCPSCAHKTQNCRHSPANMQIKVELAANKGFFAPCILKYCQKTPKKCLLSSRFRDEGIMYP